VTSIDDKENQQDSTLAKSVKNQFIISALKTIGCRVSQKNGEQAEAPKAIISENSDKEQT
jgi:hypothetical protein